MDPQLSSSRLDPFSLIPNPTEKCASTRGFVLLLPERSRAVTPGSTCDRRRIGAQRSSSGFKIISFCHNVE